ncbi:organic solute transporter subunit alpha-like [Ptychodera flava]|uniref:organic solute transporter subunit alpha-like n=1 Tax=Ptychodera flava TaxID=63121 RepID=UPI00396A8BE6
MAFRSDNCSEDLFEDSIFTDVGPGGIVALSTVTLLTVLILILFIEALGYICHKIPSRQRRSRLLWLLGTYPATCLLSLIGLYIPGASTILNLSISLYLAVAYFQFCLLVTDYYGGAHSMLAKLRGSVVSFAAPPLCCCCPCLPTFKLNEVTLRRLKVAILQVCVVLPIALFIAAVIWIEHLFDPSNVPINFIYTSIYCFTTISTLTSLYGLMMFFIMSKNPLKDYNITPKFLTISLVLALFNVQNFLLLVLTSIIVVRCIGTENGRWKVELGLVDVGEAESVEELIKMLIEKSTIVDVFFSGIGHYLLIIEMTIMFFWARHLYRTRKGNIETLIETEDISRNLCKYKTDGDEDTQTLLEDFKLR